MSADLLEPVYRQARQEWYRDHQLLNGESPLDFVGSATLDSVPSDAAKRMQQVLDWPAETSGLIRGPKSYIPVSLMAPSPLDIVPRITSADSP